MTPVSADGLPIIRFAAGLLNQGIFPESELYTTDDDIIIQTRDGVDLTANVFVPTNLSGAAPAVIFINSWGLNEYQYLNQAAKLAEQGYIVMSYATRGFGESGGSINTAGPKDTSDYSQVIDYLINNYPVDPDAIGTAGISYGSGISLMGAAQDSRVKAVTAMSSWGSLTEALYGNQTPRLVWAELLNIIGELTGKPESDINDNWQIIKNQQLHQIPDVISWAEPRSPINYVDQLNNNGTAIYFAKAYGDNLFQPNSLLAMFSQLNTPKYIDLVSGTHATAELIPGLTGIGEDRIWNNVYKWFDLHLKGEANSMAAQKPVQMKVKFKNQTDGFDQFPPAVASQETFYLHPRGWFDNGDLEIEPYDGRTKENSINAWAGTLFSTQIPVLSQLLEQLEIPIMTNIYAASDFRGIYFNTDRLDSGMRIRGTVSTQLQIKPRSNKVQLVGYLYDMDRLGNARLITHGVKTLPDVTEGETVSFNFDLVTTAYDIPAGHRLALAIDTRDPQYKKPTSDNYYVDFVFDRESPLKLTAPTL
ncbi:acyl esterase [Endozoicomonas sp. OPT23]|nr:acyl esterase [Endozoicomonas sp. OPT23]